MRPARLLLSSLVLAVALDRIHAADLYGIDWDSQDLYRISTTDASLTLVGNTGVNSLGALEFAPDGRLFGFTAGSSPMLYQINPNTAAASLVGPLNIPVFGGGLAFAPDGTAYGVNGVHPEGVVLFKLNLATGQATTIGNLGPIRDINGLGWRSDGKLVGLDSISKSLVLIDPHTAATSLLAPVAPAIGNVGGMSVVADQGYFSTSGPGGSSPGSNSLYSFNAMTGAYSLVGSFAPTIGGTGISGLALIPEPSVVGIVALGMVMLAWKRKLPL